MTSPGTPRVDRTCRRSPVSWNRGSRRTSCVPPPRSVQALNTRSRGALKMRLTTKSSSSSSASSSADSGLDIVASFSSSRAKVCDRPSTAPWVLTTWSRATADGNNIVTPTLAWLPCSAKLTVVSHGLAAFFRRMLIHESLRFRNLAIEDAIVIVAPIGAVHDEVPLSAGFHFHQLHRRTKPTWTPTLCQMCGVARRRCGWPLFHGQRCSRLPSACLFRFPCIETRWLLRRSRLWVHPASIPLRYCGACAVALITRACRVSAVFPR